MLHRWISAICIALALQLALSIGTPPAAGAINNSLGATAAPPGNVRLSAQSATALQLCPYQGNKLMIGALVYVVPAGCVTVSNSGLAASTFYYVYAFISGGSITLEIVTTGHVTSSVTGVEVKSGDATRSLVGAIGTNGSVQFEDDAINRLVVGWFNRQPAFVQGGSTANATCTSTTPVEITTAARVQIVTWNNQDLEMGVTGIATSNGNADGVDIQISRDGSQLILSNAPIAQNPTASLANNLSSPGSDGPGEGLHYYTPMCLVETGSTGTYNVNLQGLVWK